MTAPPPATSRDGGTPHHQSNSATPATTRDAGNGALPTPSAIPITTRDGGTVDEAVSRTVRDGGGIGAERSGAVPRTTRDAVPDAVPADTEAAPYVRLRLPPPLDQQLMIVDELSSLGGEADLLLCHRNSDSERLVVKLYRQRNQSINKELLERLLSAEPEHVVRTYEVGEHAGLWWEIQEYLPLGSLADLAKREGPTLPLPLLTDVLDEIFTALEYVHDTLRWVHRDIKPSNILVRSRDERLDLVLADFGLAVILATHREMRSGSRTSAYAAPEAAWGDTSAGRDWWSLGITLLEVATGQNPFRLDDGRWMEDAQINRELATVPIDVSAMQDERWRRLLRGLLTRDPAHRWGSEEIRRWRNGENPQVADDGAAYRGPQRVRPFSFLGTAHTETYSLAEHMAHKWNDAADLVLGRDLAEFQSWLREVETPEADAALRVFEENWRNVDRLIASLIAAMAPESPPTFCKYPVSPQQLPALARSAVAGEANALAAVNRLLASRALLAYAHLDGCQQLASIDDVWQRACSEVKSVAGADGIPTELRARAESTAPAALLAASADSAARAELDRRANGSATREALACEWFAAFLTQNDDDQGRRFALQWLQVNGSVVAAEQAARERRRRQQKLDAERQAERERIRQQRQTRRAASGRQRRANVRSANQRFGARFIIAAVLTVGGAFYAGSYTFSPLAGTPKATCRPCAGVRPG